jgi:hypothetical protein
MFSILVFVAMENLALWQALVCGQTCAACQCAKCGIAEKLKMCCGENKKYRRFGKLCLLILCPVNISFLFCPFTMVYFQFYNVGFVFLRLLETRL